MSIGLNANLDGTGSVQIGGSDAIQLSTGLAATFVNNVSVAGTVSITGATSVTGNLSFNSGYGSAAIAYGCRAWVNFNGTGTVAIRASGNVSSITDNGAGEYTVNFTTALSDANYAANININMNYGATLVASPSLNTQGSGASELAPSTSSFRFYCALTNTVSFDPKYVNVSVFR